MNSVSSLCTLANTIQECDMSVAMPIQAQSAMPFDKSLPLESCYPYLERKTEEDHEIRKQVTLIPLKVV